MKVSHRQKTNKELKNQEYELEKSYCKNTMGIKKLTMRQIARPGDLEKHKIVSLKTHLNIDLVSILNLLYVKFSVCFVFQVSSAVECNMIWAVPFH